MTQISKNILAMLLIFTILISVFGTWITLVVMSGQYKVPVSPPRHVASGKVGVNVLSESGILAEPAEPREIDGKVSVIVK